MLNQHFVSTVESLVSQQQTSDVSSSPVNSLMAGSFITESSNSGQPNSRLLEESLSCHSFTFCTITESEVSKAINGMCPSPSAGSDGVFARMPKLTS